MTLDASAVNRIAELGAAEAGAAPRIIAIGGETYSTLKLDRVTPREEWQLPEVKTISLHTLTGLVAYIKSGLDPLAGFIHVASETSVSIVGKVFGYKKQREVFASVEFHEESHGFGEWATIEDALVGLRTRCVPTTDSAALVKCLGNVTDGLVKTLTDDGFAQQVTVKAGATMVGASEVKSPVMLKPFRTFREVDQPQSEFVVRLQGGGSGRFPEVAVFEADGGAWRNEAIQKIVKYLGDALPEWTVVG